MPAFTPLLDKRFGRLVVVDESDRSLKRSVVVRCDCGKTKIVSASNLRSGATASCGCNRAQFNGRKHGEYGTPRFKCWRSMIDRCYRETHKSFAYYGGRGIRVCERWRNSYLYFAADMGERPSPQHSLDRIDNDGNYEPGNCRWATGLQQQNNRRVTTIVEYSGQRIALADLGRLIGIKHVTLKLRFNRGDRGERLTRPLHR